MADGFVKLPIQCDRGYKRPVVFLDATSHLYKRRFCSTIKIHEIWLLPLLKVYIESTVMSCIATMKTFVWVANSTIALLVGPLVRWVFKIFASF